jgi:VanZ family protein
VVAALSLAPSAALPSTSLGDKVEHVIAYAALGLLGVASSRHGVTRAAAWRQVLGLAVYGIVIELLQSLSPGRSPDALDVAADIVGAGAGCAAAILLRHMTRLLFDKRAAGATPCAARVAGSDVRPHSDRPAAAPSSPHKSASCVSP